MILGAALSGAKTHMAELSAEMHGHAEAALEAGSALDRLGEFARRGLELAGITIGAEAFKSLVESATDAAEKVERASAKLGASVGDIQRIGAVARLTGSDFDQMNLQLERLQLSLAKSEKASSPARAALAALGIEAQKFRDLPIPEQLDALAEAFAKFADGPTKTAAAMALLGRAGAEMIPYLDRGRSGLEELKKAAEETGVILSNQDVKALAEAAEASKELGLATQALGQDIVVSLDGAIQQSIGLLTRFVELIDGAVRAARSFGGISGEIGLLEAGQALGSGVTLSGAGLVHDRNLGAGFGGASARPQVPEMQIGGGGRGRSGKGAASTAARDTFNDEVDNAKQAAKTIEDNENNLVKEHKITWSDWAKATTDALEQEATAIKKAADQALASTALSSQQKIQILQKEKDALAEIARQEADAQAKAAEVAMRTWEGLAKEVEGAVNGSLKGLIAGTESFSTAMKKIAEDALMDMVKLAEQITKDLLLGQSLSAAFESEGLGGLLSGLGGLLGGAGSRRGWWWPVC